MEADSTNHPLLKELVNYVDEGYLFPKSDPLEWWRSHERKFPLLAKLARWILSIPASSAPSERVFSTVNEVIDKRRNRMHAETAEQVVFLRRAIPVIESGVLGDEI